MQPLTLIKPLLTSIVDYAGLFPPAQLSLAEAMKIYKQAQSASYHWMLDRFVLPAARFHEFVQLLETSTAIDLEQHTDKSSDKPWSLSVILSHNWLAELTQIQQIQAALQFNHSIMIRAFEVASLPPAEIEEICLCLPAEVTAFFEIPVDAVLDPYLQVLKQVLQQRNVAAKLRTGGITNHSFPDCTQLGDRILSFAQAQIPFKATAGLHHPLRGDYRLTYQPDSSDATMHGFLNVAILASLAYQQSITQDEAVALLEERSITSFQFTNTEVIWRNHRLSVPAIEQARQQFFHSFGSCSFQEPLDDLHNLGLL